MALTEYIVIAGLIICGIISLPLVLVSLFVAAAIFFELKYF